MKYSFEDFAIKFPFRGEDWLQKTIADNLSNYTHHKEKEICNISVHATESDEYDDDGNKNPSDYWITYDYIHRRLDQACNVESR